MVVFPVKWLHSQMRGAPVKAGNAAGSIIALLKASLIDGFGQVTLTSLTVSGGVATAVVNAGDTFDPHAVILLDGATPAVLNGEQRVSTSDSTHFTFATTAPDGTATGTITAKYAPVGNWQQTYTGTNKAVFKSTHLEANGHYLRVDESANTQLARVVGYESMTDVDTGTGPFPTDAQNAGGGRWYRSASNNATASEWLVVSDGRLFYFCNALYAGVIAPDKGYGIWPFGDAVALADGGDAWCTILSSSMTNSSYGYGSVSCGSSAPSANWGVYAARAASAASGAVGMGVRPYIGHYNSESGALLANNTSFGVAGATADGKLIPSPVFLFSGGGADVYSPRCDLPGLYHLPYSGAKGQFSNREILSGVGALAGRTLLAVRSSAGNLNAEVDGVTLFDLTGPWR